MKTTVAIRNARAAANFRSAVAAVMADQKHDHNHDFGFPDQIGFQQLYAMWDRNSLAQAMVSRIAETIWRDDPVLTVGDDTHNETPEEKAIRVAFDDRRLWAKLADAYMRSLVGDYACAILRVADNRAWHEPVGTVQGASGLWDIIPAWEGQITVSEWDLDAASPRYGMPLFYQFSEAQVDDGRSRGTARSLMIHHSRVLVFSSTGDTFGRSVLRAAFNDLITYAKVIGSGGEGFWKAARSSMSLEIDKDADLNSLAAAMGVETDKLADKLDEVVADFVAGYDKSLMLSGIKPSPMGVTLPANPEQYCNGPLQSAAASINCPSKVLIGNQTGERASTEDVKSWNATCASRRNREVLPVLRDMARRFEVWGVLPPGDWRVQWSDLTEPTGADKLAGAKIMAEINAASLGLGETPFSRAEIREQAGWDAEAPDDTPDAIPPEMVPPPLPVV